MLRASEPRDMHRLGTVALCGLLVLAGCGAVPGGGGGSGDGGPDDRTETLTPVAVPETATPVERLAPGLTARGVTDPLALANAHADTLGDRYRFHSNWTVRYRNGSVHARADQTTAAVPGRFRSRITVAGDTGFLTNGPTTTVTVWANESVLFERLDRNGTSSYRYLAPGTYNGGAGFYSTLRRPIPWRDHYAVFAGVSTRVTDRPAGGGATPTTYTLVGERLRDPMTFAAATGVREPRNVSLRATVTERGVVRTLALSYEGRLRGGEPVRVSRSVVYREPVGDVSRPPWYRAALNGSRNSRGNVPNPRLAG
jgi:hypothetical protein